MPKRGRFSYETGPRPSKTDALRRTQGGRRRHSGLKSRNALVRVPRDKLGFPQEMSTTLRYVTTFALEPVSSTANGISILANDLYDPEVSVGGHQPRGFDDYMAQYKKFTVTSSRCMVTFAYEGYYGPPPGVADSTGAPVQQIEDTGGYVPAAPSVICLVHKATGANVVSSINGFQEQDRTRWVTITPTGEAKTVRTSCAAREFFGKDFLVGSDGYTGTVAGSPTNLLYYHIMAGRNDDGPSGKVHIQANIVVDYKVTFTEPKQLAAS